MNIKWWCLPPEVSSFHPVVRIQSLLNMASAWFPKPLTTWSSQLSNNGSCHLTLCITEPDFHCVHFSEGTTVSQVVLSLYKMNSFIFQIVAVVQSLSHVQLFCSPMNYSPLSAFVHGIFQEIILEYVAISFSRRSFQSGDRTQVSCVAGRLLIS